MSPNTQNIEQQNNHGNDQAVLLARIEVKLDNALATGAVHDSRLGDHDLRLRSLETALAGIGATATSWKAWLPTIIAALGVLAAYGVGVNLK
jgi:hypothetical protein